MKKQIFVLLPFLLLLAGAFVACEEVAEVGKYDNWKGRNEAFVDSLKALNPTLVGTVAGVEVVPVGALFAIQVETTSLQGNPQYVYCKKVTANNPEGIRPLYTQSVTSFYYGTYITGDRFDGNFVGYTALDKTFSEKKEPTAFDSPTTFAVDGVIPGWTQAIQFMREGERWMLYVPYQSASDYRAIPGGSTLTFDLILKSVEE